MLNNDLSILILSCDKFSDLWSNNVLLMNKYWKNHPNFFISTDKKTDFYKEICNDFIINDTDSASRILLSLEHIKTDFVFLTLDDYLICDYVNEKYLENFVNFMRENSADYIRIYKKKRVVAKTCGKNKLKQLPLKDAYEVNFYPSIWRVSSLKKVIRENEDIWKTEVRLTKRSRECGLKCYFTKANYIYPFVDTVRKGKYLINAYKFLKKNSLYISDRPIKTKKETFNLFVQTFISENSPRLIKRTIKKIMHKKGKTFYSDYEEND